MRQFDQFSSLLSTVLRLGSGMRSSSAGPRPRQILTLYEFEGCPYCRKVREALTALDLDADVRPCPKGGSRFRTELRELGGKEQFPYLLDPNSDDQMYESDEIIRHLFARYGRGRPPLLLMLGPLTDFLVQLAMIPRFGRGVRVFASSGPAQPLELLGFEGSPGTRLVRERLSSLELPYRMLQAAPGGARGRAELDIPTLEDPNAGRSISGAERILDYLSTTFGS